MLNKFLDFISRVVFTFSLYSYLLLLGIYGGHYEINGTDVLALIAFGLLMLLTAFPCSLARPLCVYYSIVFVANILTILLTPNFSLPLPLCLGMIAVFIPILISGQQVVILYAKVPIYLEHIYLKYIKNKKRIIIIITWLLWPWIYRLFSPDNTSCEWSLSSLYTGLAFAATYMMLSENIKSNDINKNYYENQERLGKKQLLETSYFDYINRLITYDNNTTFKDIEELSNKILTYIDIIDWGWPSEANISSEKFWNEIYEINKSYQKYEIYAILLNSWCQLVCFTLPEQKEREVYIYRFINSIPQKRRPAVLFLYLLHAKIEDKAVNNIIKWNLCYCTNNADIAVSSVDHLIELCNKVQWYDPVFRDEEIRDIDDYIQRNVRYTPPFA